MHIVSRAALSAFYSRPEYADARAALDAWWAVARRAGWTNPADLKAQYRNASFIANNRVVFNIAGNKYRLIVAFTYSTGRGYIKFIGTHAQYDKVDAATVDQSKE
ncbi:MAG: type II toxin-antitoxin system HigB family toxin [Burkholderiaceae bacterium]